MIYIIEYETLLENDSMNRVFIDKFRVWADRKIIYLIKKEDNTILHHIIPNVIIDKISGIISQYDNKWYLTDFEESVVMNDINEFFSYLKNNKKYYKNIIYVKNNDFIINEIENLKIINSDEFYQLMN